MTSKINLHNNGSANPQNTFGTWTTLFFPTDTSTADILDFDGGADTGWDITVNSTETASAPDGENAIGTGDAAWVDEARVSDTHHRLITTDKGQYIISGLDNSKTYDLDLFASRDSSTSTRTGEYSVDGFSTFFELDAKLNTTVTGTFAEVSPISGEIILDWRVKSDIGSAFLNAIRITENDGGGPTGIPIFRRRIEGY